MDRENDLSREVICVDCVCLMRFFAVETNAAERKKKSADNG